MLLSGFTLPLIGVVALAIFYALIVAFSTLLFFWLPGPAAVPAGGAAVTLIAAALWLLAGRPLARRLRRAWGGRLEAFGREDLPFIGSKAGWLALLHSTLRVPPSFVLPRESLWQCEAPFFELLLWPRLRRFCRSLPGEILVRGSVAAEDLPDSGQAGRWRSVRVSAPDARSVRRLLRQLRAELAQAGPHALLIQPQLPGALTLVASIDPPSGREDLVRVEEYEQAGGACASRLLERWSVMERAMAGTSADRFGMLVACERSVGGPVLLELLGEPPTLVQVRELAPPEHATYARRALIQGGEELVPADVDTETLSRALSETLPRGRLDGLVHESRLYFRVRDQLSLSATPWPLLLALLVRAERAAHAAGRHGTVYRVLGLLFARALIGILSDLSAELDAGTRRMELALLPLARAGQGAAVGPALPVSSGRSSGRWLAGVLPWRQATVALLASWVARLVDRYLMVRRGIAARPAAEGDVAVAPDAVIRVGAAVVPVPNAEATSAAIPIWHGTVRGRLRRITTRDDLAGLAPGDVLWCAHSHAWLSEALPTVAAVLVERGGSLTHLAINCRVRRVPCASGISGAELRDGQTIEVRIDERGCTVTSLENR